MHCFTLVLYVDIIGLAEVLRSIMYSTRLRLELHELFELLLGQ